jgi:hypothetical protein
MPNVRSTPAAEHGRRVSQSGVPCAAETTIGTIGWAKWTSHFGHVAGAGVQYLQDVSGLLDEAEP